MVDGRAVRPHDRRRSAAGAAVQHAAGYCGLVERHSEQGKPSPHECSRSPRVILVRTTTRSLATWFTPERPAHERRVPPHQAKVTADAGARLVDEVKPRSGAPDTCRALYQCTAASQSVGEVGLSGVRRGTGSAVGPPVTTSRSPDRGWTRPELSPSSATVAAGQATDVGWWT